MKAELGQVDLHYHAGMERPPGLSLAEYVQHAWETGRRWLGITDHVEIYLGEDAPAMRQRAYPSGQAGLVALAAELDDLRARFPTMTLFFAPEYYTEYGLDSQRFPIDDLEPWLFELADYIIFDSGLSGVRQDKTTVLVQAIAKVSRLAAEHGKPVYMAHPLRSLASLENSWRAPTPAVLALAEAAAQVSTGTLQLDALNRLFEVDLLALAHAAREYQVPLEINGMSQHRVRRSCPAAYPAYVQAYRILAEEGARFVFGSDQHKFSEHPLADGWWKPVETLGTGCLDLGFFNQLGIQL